MRLGAQVAFLKNGTLARAFTRKALFLKDIDIGMK